MSVKECIDYINSFRGQSPRDTYKARCIVRFKDDNSEEERMILVSSKLYAVWFDDNSYFYRCGFLSELKRLCGEDGGEDFQIVEILDMWPILVLPPDHDKVFDKAKELILSGFTIAALYLSSPADILPVEYVKRVWNEARETVSKEEE